MPGPGPGMMMMRAGGPKGANPPEAPSDVSASPTSTTSVLVSWKDESSREDEFAILRRVNGSGAFTEHATVGGNVEEYEDTGLTTGDTYGYKVESRNEAGASGAAGPASATPGGDTPDAPTNLQATPIDGDQVDLTWTDNANNEDEYHVYRDDSLIATLAAGATSHSATELDEGTEYDWQIAAFNITGGESRSSIVTQATKLAAPSNMDVTEIGSEPRPSYRFTWTNNSTKHQNTELLKDGVVEATPSADLEQYDVSCSGNGGIWKTRAVHSSLPDSNFSGTVGVAGC